IAPGLIDRYLARTGVDSQQTPEPDAHDRQDNLWKPVASDHGAHGAFDSRASSHCWQLWVTTHRRSLAIAGAALAAAGLVAGARSGRLRSRKPSCSTIHTGNEHLS